MTIDLTAATSFMAGHARVLDRRRFELLLGGGDPAAVLAALDGYRNPDGGYGWGLEPDLRSPESQPGAALHAFEALGDIAPVCAPQSVALCDWLASVSHPDGGLPFALPLTTTAASAPWWQNAEPGSSLQITSVTVAQALRVAAHDPAVATHPWLDRAVRYCLDAIARIDERPFAYILAFAIRFLDAVHERCPAEAAELLSRLAKYVPADGRVRVDGGTEDEALHPLDFSPHSGLPSRSLFTPDVIAADRERLARLQQDDGGWVVDYAKISPAGVLDWRGYITVHAVELLLDEK
ncbi:hypothetical protein NLX83_03775 [Allokutzneria sp. A3M-2-11 16]|uniref:hypothetical protein n=1 Tax=Allokutzneria sp. A3M-2-11 16 TaxID=2962043 RepID=UPI0020B8D748|nr:hypothetical protein [Allokutzneria sp. A3M-2-11 16]MCP3798371.1 hypothetical protein [Allokutzneria sp. A3M-2-11 16]